MAKRTLRRVPTLDAGDVKEATRTNAARELPARCFKDGAILSRLSEEHWACFSKLMNEKRDMVPNRELTLGSACAGSGSEHVAAWYFQQAACKGSAQAFSIRSVFACEIVEAKRTWIKGVHVACSGSARCLVGSARRVSNLGAAQSSPGPAQGESKPGSAASAPGPASGVSSPASAPNDPGSAQGVSGSGSAPSAPGSAPGTDDIPCLF